MSWSPERKTERRLGIVTSAIRTAAQTDGLLDDDQWKRITKSLLDIVLMLREWSKAIGDVRPPAFKTLEEAMKGLWSLKDEELPWLIKWLNSRNQSHWTELQMGIRNIQKHCWKPQFRSSCSKYFQAREKLGQSNANPITRCEPERFKVADGILDLASSLEDAVKNARAKKSVKDTPA